MTLPVLGWLAITAMLVHAAISHTWEKKLVRRDFPPRPDSLISVQVLAELLCWALAVKAVLA